MSHTLIADLFLNFTWSNSLDNDYQFPPETEQFDNFIMSSLKEETVFWSRLSYVDVLICVGIVHHGLWISSVVIFSN